MTTAELPAVAPDSLHGNSSAVSAVAPTCVLRPGAGPLTYAAVVRGGSPDPAPRRPPPAASRVLGKPRVSLPFSQLAMGRTEPPWNARAWNTRSSELVPDEEHGQVLRVRYPRGSGTSASKGPPGGAIFLGTPRGFPATDVTLHYMVRFAPNFRWSRGGKLPGLSVGEGPASGGHHSARAASCRFVWQPRGGIVAYVYTPAGVSQSPAYAREAHRKGGKFGDHLFAAAQLHLRGDNQWNRLVMRIRLNGFDDHGRPRPDGVLTVSVNGKAATLPGIIWRRFPDVRISHVLFSTFYGGSWTCPETTHADFAGFFVT